jgi:precorrin-3B methylase
MVHEAKIVKLGAKQFDVSTSKTKRLRQVEFTLNDKTIIGIEQNPGTKSRWAKEARAGKMVMQFIQDGRYVAVVSAGKVTMYGKRVNLMAYTSSGCFLLSQLSTAARSSRTVTRSLSMSALL